MALDFLSDLARYLRVRKKWFLGIPIIFLILLSFLIVFAEGSALAPFIYTLF